jgi:hypothetical protein
MWRKWMDLAGNVEDAHQWLDEDFHDIQLGDRLLRQRLDTVQVTFVPMMQ